MKQPQSTLKKITSQLAQLDRAELAELRHRVEALLEAQGQAAEEDSSEKGHIELKMIGKHGPYKYRRYWEDGKLKSEYKGKADAIS